MPSKKSKQIKNGENGTEESITRLGVWKVGKNGGAIVTSQSIFEDLEHTSKYRKESIEFYGGYVICESVPEELRPLLATVPDMVEFILDVCPCSTMAAKIRKMLEDKSNAKMEATR